MQQSFPVSEQARRAYQEHAAKPSPPRPAPVPTVQPRAYSVTAQKAVLEQPSGHQVPVTRGPMKAPPLDLRILAYTFRLIHRLFLLYPKARSLALALAGGPTTPTLASARLATCEKCPMRKMIDGKAFCKSCGCGNHRLAALANKARMAWATCPRGLWPQGRAWRWR